MKKAERVISIDRFRGLMVLLMIVFEYFRKYDCFGVLAKVASQGSKGITLFPGFAVHDIAVSIFFYAIALNFVASFKRRYRLYGKKEAYRHILERGLSIIGLGTCLRTSDLLARGYSHKYPSLLIISVVSVLYVVSLLLLFVCCVVPKLNNKRASILKLSKALLCINGLVCIVYGSYNVFVLFGGKHSILRIWSVLSAIGLAILIAIPSVNLSTLYRGLYGGILFALYALAYQMIPNFNKIVEREVQGGVLGAVSWASLLVLFSVFADLYYKDREELMGGGTGRKPFRYLGAVLLSIVVAVIGAHYFEVNKEMVSSGFVLISISISTSIFGIISLFDKFKPKFSPMIWWGKNPLLLFVFEYLLINVPIALIPGMEELGLFGASAYIAIMVLVFTYVCYRFDKKEIILKF